SDKKGHVCPPSDATHPRDRWESLFVYAFICKFTTLRGKVEGFNNALDFEEALLASAPHPILVEILARFVLNLRPNARNISAELISGTVQGTLADYFKMNERTVFWDHDLHANVDPFSNMQESFFTAPWDLKLKILRTLVELQLTHSAHIKQLIDSAWGIVHNKHKKGTADVVLPDPSSPFSMEALSFAPLGQDKDRKRYWVVDDSPRVYLSTNPWKIASAFQAVSSTRPEYVAIIEELKANAPSMSTKASAKRARFGQAHMNLIEALEARLEAIDKEIARMAKARKKAEKNAILMAQAELRTTRTRRQVKRTNYVFASTNLACAQDGQDDFVPENEPYEDEGFGSDTGSSSRRAPSEGLRRSARTAVTNGTKTVSESEWRGERRSRRLGGGPQVDEPPPKRARTVDTVESSEAERMEVESVPDNMGTIDGIRVKTSGAAAVKASEKAVEHLAGKKKSKFWYYAVEP
ncbi:hypothetical protein K488DRAFT_32764, partial [Vararia minispora EC-137]